jgi:DNA-binding transcriptional MerR regulator
VRSATGSGTQRLYGFRDILLLKIIKRLLDAGVSLQQIRTAVNHLRERGTDDLTRVTLMSDGASVYECTSNDEIIDLLQGGQGVFGIAVPDEQEEAVEKFREFLDHVSPEDFES